MFALFVLSRESPYNRIARLGSARLLFVPGVRLNLARFEGEAAHDHRWDVPAWNR
jgi:hypothetical protein